MIRELLSLHTWAELGALAAFLFTLAIVIQ
jgi:hypothetical protein